MKNQNLIQTLLMYFCFSQYLCQMLNSQIKYIEQRNIQQQEFHYPSKIFIQSQRGFDKLTPVNSNVDVVYFSKNTTDNYFIIIFNLKPSQQYQGIKFRLNQLTNKVVFIEDYITPNLNFLLNRFNLDSIPSNFQRYYPNITKDIVSSQEFQQFKQQKNNDTNQDILIGSIDNLDTLKEQLLANENLQNNFSKNFNQINNNYDPNGDISTTIIGTRYNNIRYIPNQPQKQSNINYIPNSLSQFNLEQRIESIPKKKTLSAFLPGISSWSLLKQNEQEFQIFLNHLKQVVQNSQKQYLEKNLSILFSKYNLTLKNMDQYEIQDLKYIIQNKIFLVDNAYSYINRTSASRQMNYIKGQGYDFLISTFLHFLKGGKQISQSQAVQLIDYTFNYGKTENLSYNQEIQELFKDVISILLIGKPKSTFISVMYDIIKEKHSKNNQLIQCKMINLI